LSRIAKRPFFRLALTAVLASTFALAGCGRKGPLDPPPAGSLTGAPVDSRPSTPDKRIPLDYLLN
jgi:predicted small lipoprotein YifL